jgi:hypothetical protein
LTTWTSFTVRDRPEHREGPATFLLKKSSKHSCNDPEIMRGAIRTF